MKDLLQKWKQEPWNKKNSFRSQRPCTYPN